MLQSVELNDNSFCAFNDSKDKKIFRLSNTARNIYWVTQIFDAILPNFTNGRAIAPPAPLSPTPMHARIINLQCCQRQTQVLFQQNGQSKILRLGLSCLIQANPLVSCYVMYGTKTRRTPISLNLFCTFDWFMTLSHFILSSQSNTLVV